MIQSLFSQLRSRHLAMVGFCLLALTYYFLFRYDNYGIEEGAARALLINWSIVQQVANPIAFFDVPDLRALLFVVLDLHWVGSLAAVKVFTMLFLFATALMVHRWSVVRDGDEVGMLATSLLLLSPLCLMQADSVGSGIYLLFGFISIYWLHDKLRREDHTVPSYFFLMLLLVAMVVSIHPVGLAAPVALLLSWQRMQNHRMQRMVMVGVAISALIMVLLRWGWSGIEQSSSIPNLLTDIWLGSPLIHANHAWLGYLIALLLLAVLVAMRTWRRLDVMSGTLLLAAAMGLYHPDAVWSMMVMVLLYYLGVPALIRLNAKIGGQGVTGQRGLVLLVITIVALVCMQSMKQMHYIRVDALQLPSDQLISVLAKDADDVKKPFLAASQWPGRTMLACRRDVFPLPPANDDMVKFQKSIQPLTHIVFDHHDAKFQALAHSMAAVNGDWETVALTHYGVVLKRRTP